jgi:hypothetical protein
MGTERNAQIIPEAITVLPGGSHSGLGQSIQVVVNQANVDLTIFQLQLHRVHEPGSLDSENTPIEFTIVHP